MSKRILWTFGDSWTAGSGIVKTDNISIPLSRVIGKDFAFPSILAKELGFHNVNLGVGGMGNESIYQNVVYASPNFTKDDFILICFSTPFRDRPKDSSTLAIVTQIQLIQDLSVILKGKNYLICHAFGPLIPEYTSTEEVTSVYTPYQRPFKKYLNWGLPNNTLMDVLAGTYLDENKVNPVYAASNDGSSMHGGQEYNDYFLPDWHPSVKGHLKLANFLKLEIEKRL